MKGYYGKYTGSISSETRSKPPLPPYPMDNRLLCWFAPASVTLPEPSGAAKSI
jgi:hypothetical protein